MSKQINEKLGMDTDLASGAPTQFRTFDSGTDRFAQRGPPPSYEESQRMTVSSQVPPQCPPYMQTYETAAPMPNGAYGVSYPYHSVQPQNQYYQPMAAAVAPSSQMTVTHNYQMQADGSSSPKVLALSKGAKLRTTASGAVIIPPPPPGIAPTPAQYAAMQGQPVYVKKTKKSFF